MWVFIAASFFLPYVAVVVANAGTSADPGGPGAFAPDEPRRSIAPPPET
jgi:hypothetical protein